MPSRESAAIVLKGLRQAGIGLVASLPDAFLAPVIEALGASNDFVHVPLSREEDGVGICTGAYLGGKRTALVMQNAGLLNSCNALTTALQDEIPLLLVILYAGAVGDVYFPMIGLVTEPVLAALRIPCHIPASIEAVPGLIGAALVQAYNIRRPVAVLLKKEIM